MVKHVSLMIGCIILSLSATLPTNCLPIEENGQIETNFLESRSKRQVSLAKSAADSSAKATASTQTVPNSLLLSALLPLLTKGAQTMPPPMSAGGSGGLAGLPGLLLGLNPVLGGLGGILGNLGGTVNGLVGQVENGIPLVSPITDLLQQIITALLGGGGGGGMSMPPLPGVSKPPLNPLALLALLSQPQIKQTVTSTASSSSSSQALASTGPKG